jgi:hypothetical protein
MEAISQMAGGLLNDHFSQLHQMAGAERVPHAAEPPETGHRPFSGVGQRLGDTAGGSDASNQEPVPPSNAAADSGTTDNGGAHGTGTNVEHQTTATVGDGGTVPMSPEGIPLGFAPPLYDAPWPTWNLEEQRYHCSMCNSRFPREIIRACPTRQSSEGKQVLVPNERWLCNCRRPTDFDVRFTTLPGYTSWYCENWLDSRRRAQGSSEPCIAEPESERQPANASGSSEPKELGPEVCKVKAPPPPNSNAGPATKPPPPVPAKIIQQPDGSLYKLPPPGTPELQRPPAKSPSPGEGPQSGRVGDHSQTDYWGATVQTPPKAQEPQAKRPPPTIQDHNAPPQPKKWYWTQ